MKRREKKSGLRIFFLGLLFLFSYPAEGIPPESFLADTLYLMPDQIRSLTSDELKVLSAEHVLVVTPESNFPSIRIRIADGSRQLIRSDREGTEKILHSSDEEKTWIPWALALVVTGTMIAFFTIRF
ncbi:MAG: hypothetical protein HUU10_01805 [Bacteroidetes bacterium]|nr:hypothetical protein [Bacteroidota bacterium]